MNLCFLVNMFWLFAELIVFSVIFCAFSGLRNGVVGPPLLNNCDKVDYVHDKSGLYSDPSYIVFYMHRGCVFWRIQRLRQGH